MNLIVPDAYKPIIADGLGFPDFDSAVAAVSALPLNEFGYAEIRKNGVFIQKTSNRRSYASVIVGGGKSGMGKDWAAGERYLTERGIKIQRGIPE